MYVDREDPSRAFLVEEIEVNLRMIILLGLGALLLLGAVNGLRKVLTGTGDTG